MGKQSPAADGDCWDCLAKLHSRPGLAYNITLRGYSLRSRETFVFTAATKPETRQLQTPCSHRSGGLEPKISQPVLLHS